MRKKIKLIWQLYPSYLLIILISMTAIGWYSINSLKTFYLDQTVIYLKDQGHLLEHEIFQYLTPLNSKYIDTICKSIGRDSSIRVSILLPNGDVIGDSEKNPSIMDNHSDRPEIIKASGGNSGSSIRYSRTIKKNMMYVAIPLKKNNKTIAIIRTSIPLTFIDNKLKSIEFQIFVGGLIIALLASGISLYISRRISRPIEEMKIGAEQFAKGNLSFKLHAPNTKELASLCEAMNQMAVHLKNRIKTVLHQQNEIESILSSMIEGVIAVDKEARILNINNSAVNMINKASKSDDYIGKSIQEKIRNIAVYEFVKETLENKKIMQGDVEFNINGKQIINICSTPLSDSMKIPIGALIVLNDVTQLRHLENIRKDFVANVSHEIRTPLTTINGFVETLLSGAMKNPDENERFLKIIDKHVKRLTAIIEDLLQLAKIEQNGANKTITRENGDIRDMIISAVQVCELKAHDKNITINVLCDENLSYNLNIPLIEQAVVNLLDNAIKYSEKNSKIDIQAKLEANNLMISIKDYGTGIPKEHLSRLFERFYRVDKARSRKMGGTGLGLAIVKHIVQAHEGSVNVESFPGKGSNFIIKI